MFLLSLDVRNFQVLRDVRLKFGRGLNVVFGPNDLGKSTLAEALRVAFLLPATSTSGVNLRPWGTELVPSVVVKFEMNGVIWQITKSFEGTKGNARLQRAGAGGSLTEEGSGRAVEEKLREILAWGVPGPGGRGAPKGLPESYLSTALLGRQDQVTAILAASPEDDGVDSGLELITNALGALGQDPLVGQLLQRLQQRTEKVFTESGQVRRAEDSPLVQLTNKIKDQKSRLDKLEDRVRQSGEIENRVQSLTEQRILAAEECFRLQHRVQLLEKVTKAEEELEGVRNRERAIAEGRRDLAAIEKKLFERDLSLEQATLALLRVEEVQQAARERRAKIIGGRDKIQENALQAREARRAELLGNHDAAARQAQSARDVIQAREQVKDREREIVQAEEDHRKAQQAELQAQVLAELATLLAEQRQANTVVEALSVARRELDDRATFVTIAQADLKNVEDAIENAKFALGSLRPETFPDASSLAPCSSIISFVNSAWNFAGSLPPRSSLPA